MTKNKIISIFIALRGLKTYIYKSEKERSMSSTWKIALVLIVALAVVIGSSGCRWRRGHAGEISFACIR